MMTQRPRETVLLLAIVTSSMVTTGQLPTSASPAVGVVDAGAGNSTAAPTGTPTVDLAPSSHAASRSPLGNSSAASSPSPALAIPPGWQDMCLVDDLTLGSKAIDCHVTGGMLWDFDTFRNWSRSLEPGQLVDLKVTCSMGSVIFLPWPYRAPNLRSLAVKGCSIFNWMQDSSRPDFLKSIEDTLEYLRMENNTAFLSFRSLREILKEVNEEFDCGPRHLKSFVQSNVQYSFDLTEELSEEEVIEMFSGYLQQSVASDYDCRYNSLEEYEMTHRFPSNVFSTHLLKRNARMPRLRSINLSYNAIDRVPETVSVWREEFPSLITLNMSHNFIQKFSFRTFSFASPGKIDLTYNNISTLAVQELNSMNLLTPVLIDVRRNPYHCACATAEFSEFLHENSGPADVDFNPYYAYLWDLTCQSPPERKGRKLSEFSEADLCNENREIFVVFILLPIAAILVALYFRFQLEVDVFVFTHLGWGWRCGRGAGQLESRDYDVYVSHSPSQHDMEFVLRELRPRLEVKDSAGNRKFKLCLECRDFEVGAHIANNIASKMAESRAVVMVLSPDMPVDGWAEFEFQEALFRAVSEKRRLLIFLQRGSLHKARLSSALLRALNLFPVIKVGERQFWSKLEYFLRRNTSCQVPKRGSCYTCFTCCRSRRDPGEELKKVNLLARQNLEKSRKSCSQSYETRETTPKSNDHVVYSLPSLGSEEQAKRSVEGGRGSAAEIEPNDVSPGVDIQAGVVADPEKIHMQLVAHSQDKSLSKQPALVLNGECENHTRGNHDGAPAETDVQNGDQSSEVAV